MRLNIGLLCIKIDLFQFIFQVSWIRHSDSGLLAVNDFVYTTSHRIKVYHENGSVDYRLSINPVELTDASLYECQVSTTPHTSHFMKITVMGKHKIPTI